MAAVLHGNEYCKVLPSYPIPRSKSYLFILAPAASKKKQQQQQQVTKSVEGDMLVLVQPGMPNQECSFFSMRAGTKNAAPATK